MYVRWSLMYWGCRSEGLRTCIWLACFPIRYKVATTCSSVWWQFNTFTTFSTVCRYSVAFIQHYMIEMPWSALVSNSPISYHIHEYLKFAENVSFESSMSHSSRPQQAGLMVIQHSTFSRPTKHSTDWAFLCTFIFSPSVRWKISTYLFVMMTTTHFN